MGQNEQKKHKVYHLVGDFATTRGPPKTDFPDNLPFVPQLRPPSCPLSPDNFFCLQCYSADWNFYFYLGRPSENTKKANEQTPTSHTLHQQARRFKIHQTLLRCGYDTFRPLQIDFAAIYGRDSVVVLPTGGGKSLCYRHTLLSLTLILLSHRWYHL